MRIRYILPAMGIVAFSSTAAVAGDAPLSFSGWVDNILTIGKANEPSGTENPDVTKVGIAFNTTAVVKADWQIGSDVSGRINLWTDNVGSGTTLNVREARAAWALTDQATLSMGKTYSPLGWIASDSINLYTINNSLIGYVGTYGNDPLGVSVAWSRSDSPLSASLWLNNGVFSVPAARNQGPVSFTGGSAIKGTRENSDLGFIADVIYNLPDKKGSVNLELAYDMNGGSNGAEGTGATVGIDPISGLPVVFPASATVLGGDVLQIGANTTLTLVDNLTLGAEVIFRTTGEAEAAGGDVSDSGSDQLNALLMANYALPDMKTVPVSITGMVQYWQLESDVPDTEEATAFEVALAVLTNPTGTSKFAWNFEIAYTNFEPQVPTGTDVEDVSTFVFSTEALLQF